MGVSVMGLVVFSGVGGWVSMMGVLGVSGVAKLLPDSCSPSACKPGTSVYISSSHSSSFSLNAKFHDILIDRMAAS